MAKVQSFDCILMHYIMNRKNDKAKPLLNADLAKATDGRKTLLHHVAGCGNETILHRLLELGSEVDSFDSDKHTPLMIAVEYRHAKCVEVLLEAGADIDLVDAHGKSAWSIALDVACPPVIHILYCRLLARFSSIDEVVAELNGTRSTFYFAACTGDVELMEHLLARGFKVNSRGPDGKSALQAVVALNNVTTANWLIDKGADVNGFDEDGGNPLFDAVRQANARMVQLLLDLGADINCSTDARVNCAPLRAAFYRIDVEEEPFDECVEILLQNGASLENGIVGYGRRTTTKCSSDSPNDKRVRMVVSHLALQKKLGKSTEKAMMQMESELKPEAFDAMKEYCTQCQRVLNCSMFGDLKLLELLMIDERRMLRLVRNEDFIAKIEQACSEEELSTLYPYYWRMLAKNCSRARRVIGLEKKALKFFCNVFNKNYNECYVPAREIIQYLDEDDLEQLVIVGNI